MTGTLPGTQVGGKEWAGTPAGSFTTTLPPFSIRMEPFAFRPTTSRRSTNFPSFSIILGDLHPHLSALPFAVVALALAIGIARQPSVVSSPQIIGAGWIGGALYALNSWDLPTYFGLIALALLWNSRKMGWKSIAIRVGILCATALIAWAPFLAHFTPPLSGDESVVPSAFRNVPIVSTIFKIIGANHWEYTSAGSF